jgi:hypothetical protein
MIITCCLACYLDAKSWVCRPQADVAQQCQSVAAGPAGSAPRPANTLASLAESKQNTNDENILGWHHVDHHQITIFTSTITWNQDCPPSLAGSPFQGKATAATEGSWTPTGKGVKTVTQEYKPSKWVEVLYLRTKMLDPWPSAGLPVKRGRCSQPPQVWHIVPDIDKIFDMEEKTLKYPEIARQTLWWFCPYIPRSQYDIVSDIEVSISNVQRASKLIIVLDVEGFSSTMQYGRSREFRFGQIWSILNIVPDFVYDMEANI